MDQCNIKRSKISGYRSGIYQTAKFLVPNLKTTLFSNRKGQEKQKNNKRGQMTGRHS